MVPVHKGGIMAGKAWTSEEDRIIRESFGALLPIDIAALLPRRTHKAVQHRAKALGLWLTPQEVGALNTERYDAQAVTRLGEPIADWLRRRYVVDRASYRKLCVEAGVNTRTLMRWMRVAGLEPISSSEAALRQMERNPNAITRMQSPDAKRRRAVALAQTRQRDWQTFCTPRELEFLDALRAAGLSPVPQLAVGSYNIDAAFPAVMLAVELDPRWHITDSRIRRDAARDAKLETLGWTVLRLDTRASISFNVQKVSNALQSRAATHPR